MPENAKKTLIMLAKLLVGAVLMAWVLLGAHWNDFVRSKDGKTTYSVLAAPGPEGRFVVRKGSLWWARTLELSADDLQPVEQADSQTDAPKRYLRPGFLKSISRIQGWMLLAAMAASLTGVLVTALRWWMLLAIQSIRISLWEAVRLTFLGQFYSLIVPGTVGGDIVKAYYVTKHTHAKAGAVLSVFVDRVFGLAALTLVAGAALSGALLSGLGSWSDPMMRYSATVMICVVAAVVGVMSIVLSRRLRRVLHLQRFYKRLPFAKAFESFGQAARVYRRRWKTLAKVGGMMLAAPAIWVAALAILGGSINLPVPWHSYFLYIPLIYILGSVPLTPGGAGWIEYLYLVFFAGLANSSEILAFALLARLFPIAWAIPGMIVAVSGPRLPKIQTMQVELGM
ncbi:MAG: lysylphosphatidylglycerol synthase transmembrane domain-containing protein [Phycisphaerae bacterium]|nr:lysylphosphatidylglycerol synthase transmembrane domain-containing protein [Phycisphaerae bacterium]